MPEQLRKMSEIMKEMSETLLATPDVSHLRKRHTSPSSSPTLPGTRAWDLAMPERATAMSGRR